jgi:hypothetical protein
MGTTPATDIVQESERILKAAAQQGVVLRLFGGLAIRLHSPSASHRTLVRSYADIDFFGLKKQGKDIRKLFAGLGYAPREIFNALQGDRRLIFQDIENQRRIDVFLDVFEMCHHFDFKDRLQLDPMTIPLADLLDTKLQVVEITEREYKDIIALLRDHEVGTSDAPEVINGKYIADLCAADWGIYKTLTINIANILGAMPEFVLEASDRELVEKRVRKLLEMIESAPKSMKWKMRARVGEKKRWYELPEADKKIVTDQRGIK